MISAYSTFGPTLLPKTSKPDLLHELRDQLLDIKVPTAKQIAGRKYGEEMAKREAAQRAKKPRGLIEYGIEQLGR